MIFEFLAQHRIPYQRFDHPPVHTCEDAKRLIPNLPGTDTKNLFLRDGRGRRHFILAVKPEKKVDFKRLAAELGIPGLGFASADRLKKFLNLEPGSVTLLGVINDPDKAVELLIDQEIWSGEAFQCHPLVNTGTLVIKRCDLERIFQLTGHQIWAVRVPSKEG